MNDLPSRLPCTSRRDLLRTFAAAGAGALLPARELLGQAGGPGPIDVHQHYQEGGSSRWSVAKVLELMDKNGIATVILSGGSYGDQVYTGTESGRNMARKLNDYAAKIVSDHPKKFGFSR
jgi:hypothetical protein